MKKNKINLKIKKFGINSKFLSLVFKELNLFFSNPTGYIIFIIYIILVSIIFFGVFRFTEYQAADLQLLFSSIAFSFLLVVPALTMGIISKEKQTGTIEYLLTKPVSAVSVVMSKIFSVAIILLLLLLLTVPFTLYLNTFSSLDFGQTLAQYIGTLVLGISFATIGIAISSSFKSEVVSLLITIFLSAFFVVSGSQIIRILPFGVDFILERLSLLSHYQSISRGVLDIRDLLYFVAFITLFLSAGFFMLVREKYPKKHKNLKNTKIFIVVLMFTGLTIGIMGQLIPGRIDFTTEGIYTLSESTNSIVKKIPDKLQINFYSSSNLPIEFQSTVRSVEDILRDYANLSSNIGINFIDPSKNQEEQQNALQGGLQELVFAVNTEDSSQRVVGFLGIVLKYLDKTESIELASSAPQNLEYELTKKIKKITNIDRKNIAFVSNNTVVNIEENFNSLLKEAGEIFNVSKITLSSENFVIPENTDAIVFLGPKDNFGPEALNSIKSYIDQSKGGAFFALNPIYVSLETQTAEPIVSDIYELLSGYGLIIQNEIAFDLERHNAVSVRNSFFPVRYPLWLIPQTSDSSISILRGLSEFSMLWASPLYYQSKDNLKIYPLIETSSNSGTKNIENLNLNVDQNWNQENASKRIPLAIAIESNSKQRIVITGDSKFLSESANLVAQGDNLNFALSALEWLSKDDAVGEIRAKDRSPSRIFLTDSDKTVMVLIASLIPILLVITGGGIILIRRKQITKKSYQK